MTSPAASLARRCGAPRWRAPDRASRRLRPLVLGLALLLSVPTHAEPLSRAQLAAVADDSTIELTTTGRRSGQARTVTIWFVVDDAGRLFVQSGSGGRTDWYRNLRQTPAVSFRIGALHGTATAVPIADAAETARVHALFHAKYLRARILGWFGGETGRGQVVLLSDPKGDAKGDVGALRTQL